MAKCMYCSEQHERKGKYCSDSCKQKAYRRNTTVTDDSRNVTVSDTITVERVTGGVCWCCGKEIHEALVCCGDCAWSGKAKQIRAGAEPPRIGELMPCYM